MRRAASTALMCYPSAHRLNTHSDTVSPKESTCFTLFLGNLVPEMSQQLTQVRRDGLTEVRPEREERKQLCSTDASGW